MPAIYIDRKEPHLDVDHGALVVRLDGERVAGLPLAGADRVVLRRAGTVSVRLLAELGERGIGLFVLGGRTGAPRAHLLGCPHGDASVRFGQMRLAARSQRVVDLARHAVHAKVTGHRRLIALAMQQRPDLRKPMFDALAEIDGILARLPAVTALEALRGSEGAAAASFFRAYMTLFPDSLGFIGRNRRPPRDPVNACLSLGYTLLHGEAVRAAWTAGLDPQIGFLHALLAGRESLGCDLVEMCRPAVDELVWSLFRDRTLRGDHFRMVEGACLLGKTGRAAYYEAFEAIAVRERRRLRHVTAGLARLARSAAGDGP
ncbi:CRISPR-associated endonuclease Cas1 [Vineibacter terrae]|nr:CRISPR-associated endonuclease Cas1 [Vineibacter terrae]